MSQLPLVSIICHCYNHASFVEECLNSVINQSYKNIELIIVDDCSNDNSIEVIENWLKKNPEVQFIKNPKNLGITKSFNNATEFCNGEFIIDLAADDVLLSNCVYNQLKVFNENTNVCLVFGNAELIDDKGTTIGYHFAVDENLKVIDKDLQYTNYESILKGGNCMCSVSAMYKKKTFIALGKYDEKLFYEDLDFWLRISKKHELAFTDEILVKKRELSNSLTRSFFKKNNFSKKINESNYRILRKAFKANTKKNEFKALLKRIHNLLLRNLKLMNFYLVVQLLILKLKTEIKILLTA